MWSQQVLVVCLCLFLGSHQVIAVVNNAQSAKNEESSKSSSSVESTQADSSATSNNVADSIADSSDEKSNRRDAPLTIGDTYGAPIAIPSNTYLPSGPSNINLPVPIYGVPDSPSNNIVYPAPPPDIPPPIGAYGLSQINLEGPKDNYGPPPSNNYGPPISSSYGLPPVRYGIPSFSPPPKSFFPGPGRGGLKGPKPLYGLPPRPQYGLPTKPLFTPKLKYPQKGNFNSYRPQKPLNTYGPPSVVQLPFKDNYSPSKINLNLNSNYLSSNSFSHSSHSSQSNSYVSHSSHGSPSASTQYGVPDSALYGPPNSHYGPPEPVAHPKPPHPGAPAPPTPPDIKYDGWQPIPGLVSKVPSDSYGVPQNDFHSVGDLSFNNDLSPPPLGDGGHGISLSSHSSHNSHNSHSSHGSASLSLSNSYGAPHGGLDDISHGSHGGAIDNAHGSVGQLSLSDNFAAPHGGLSDSYGAPLASVTGSGGVVVSSGDAHQETSSGALSLGLSAAGIGHDTSIQAIKSIGYEIFPNTGGISGGSSHGAGVSGLEESSFNLGGSSHSSGGSSYTLGGSGHNSGGSIYNLGGSSHGLGSGHSFGGSSHNPGGSNHNSGGSYHNSGGSHHNSGSSHHNSGGSHHNSGGSSHGFGGSSHTLGGFNFNLGESSHNLGGSSHSLGGSSHSLGGSSLHHTDSYSAPPANSYSSNGPYAAAHSYNNNGFSSSSFGSNNFGSSSSHNSHNSFNGHKSHGHKGLSLSSSGIGLIPPSGLYGVPPSGQYGTPLFNSHSGSSHLNALKINQPKRPVLLREPVPSGLFDSIAKHTAQKESFGYTSDLSNSLNIGGTYLPPPVPDTSKPVNEVPPAEPTSLYSLPNLGSGVSFQNVVHGSSTAGLSNQFNYNSGGALNIEGASAQALTSYNAPSGIVDGSYSLPVQTGGISIGLDALPPVSIDLTGSYSQSNYAHANSFAVPHDCSLHKSQPLPPQLSYGVPSANSYTASLSSLTANIGGAHAQIQQNYGVPDLHTAHSQTISTESRANQIETETHGKSYGKSVAQSFGPSSELIESQSVDLKNIPVQGALGSYTLQIQSADGGLGAGPGVVPHQQVLNDGLLQSILAAIEQPQQNGGAVLGQPIIQLQPSVEQSYIRNDSNGDIVIPDAEPQQSASNEYVVVPSATETSEVNESDKQDVNADSNLRLVDDNEIALYFSNNQQRHKKETMETAQDGTKKTDEAKEVENSH